MTLVHRKHDINEDCNEDMYLEQNLGSREREGARETLGQERHWVERKRESERERDRESETERVTVLPEHHLHHCVMLEREREREGNIGSRERARETIN